MTFLCLTSKFSISKWVNLISTEHFEETFKDLKEIAKSIQIVVTAAMSMVENVENNFRTIYED